MMGQLSIAEYLKSYDWFQQVKEYRSMYRERRDAMLESLAEYLPSSTWTVPDGGFYTWVTLPEGLDAHAMLPRAVTHRVAYVSGTAFFANGEGRDYMRLSYCYPTPENIREGVRRLGTVVEAEKELVNMFGAQRRTPPGSTVEYPSTETI